MIAAIPQATVVIANPTHFAVALRYDRMKDAAPVCVAKGVDKIALKIRETAEEHNVPVIENPPLARSLHGSMDVDQSIPEDFYEAVAEIINYVYKTDARAITL